MPTSTQELQSFQKYAAARIQNGGAKLELDELLEEWKSRRSVAMTALSGTCCVNDVEMQQARDQIVELLDQHEVKPVEDLSGMMSPIAPDDESADDFLQAIGRSQTTDTTRDWLND